MSALSPFSHHLAPAAAPGGGNASVARASRSNAASFSSMRGSSARARASSLPRPVSSALLRASSCARRCGAREGVGWARVQKWLARCARASAAAASPRARAPRAAPCATRQCRPPAPAFRRWAAARRAPATPPAHLRLLRSPRLRRRARAPARAGRRARPSARARRWRSECRPFRAGGGRKGRRRGDTRKAVDSARCWRRRRPLVRGPVRQH